MPDNIPHNLLRYYVTGAIARGEKPIVAEQSAVDQAQAAFNRAIRTGHMTELEARAYMFMGFDTQGRAVFKHRNTRRYLAHD